MRLFQMGSTEQVREITNRGAKSRWVGGVVARIRLIRVRQRFRQHLATGRNLSTRDGLRIVETALVGGVVGVFVFLECLHDGQIDQQNDGQNDREYGD